MQLPGASTRRPGANLGTCLALLLWTSLAGAAVDPAPQGGSESLGNPVEVEIIGQRSPLSLRLEIDAIEQRTFDLFNQFNDVREFDISCEKVIVTGSKIPERECTPRYMKRARSKNSQDFLLSDLNSIPGEPAVNTRGVPQTQQELWFQNQRKHEAFNARFRELAMQHPELAAATIELQVKRQRLRELEERQQGESALGRFFSGFGNRDED